MERVMEVADKTSACLPRSLFTADAIVLGFSGECGSAVQQSRGKFSPVVHICPKDINPSTAWTTLGRLRAAHVLLGVPGPGIHVY